MSNAGCNRRDVVLAGAAAAALAVWLGRAASARAQGSAASTPVAELAAWEREVKRITSGGRPGEGKMAVEVPELVENGNTVPFTVSLESPMTPEDHVRAVHVIATANPHPLVAEFNLTPELGVASVASRMRLIRSQEVIFVAELSDGRYLLTKRPVKVTIGCCGN